MNVKILLIMLCVYVEASSAFKKKGKGINYIVVQQPAVYVVQVPVYVPAPAPVYVPAPAPVYRPAPAHQYVHHGKSQKGRQGRYHAPAPAYGHAPAHRYPSYH